MSAPVARDTADLLAGLDRHRNAKGSAELYDALITANAAQVRDELGKALRHPLFEETCAWLQVRGLEPPRPPSADEVLARLGITDVEAVLLKKDAEILRLKNEVGELNRRGSDALKAATGYSFITVLLAAAAILGWLAALGVIPIVPEVNPTLDKSKSSDKSEQSDGVGLDGLPGARGGR